jgi:tRNA (guanine37-N1)-methyltransferase
MFDALIDFGVTGRAIREGMVEVGFWNPRDHAQDRHRSVDDRPYGGGPGMVMSAPPLVAAIREAKASVGSGAKVLYLSPQGPRLTQAKAEALAAAGALVLVAGRYEGIDERVIEAAVDEEISIGDYVLSGGELPAMVLMDAVIRQLPGSLGDADSARQESFVDGLLDCPHYTRPETYEGIPVPAVLMSGDHAAISRWRLKQSLGRTWQRRPDLIERRRLNESETRLLDEYRREHAGVDVKVPRERVG